MELDLKASNVPYDRQCFLVHNTDAVLLDARGIASSLGLEIYDIFNVLQELPIVGLSRIQVSERLTFALQGQGETAKKHSYTSHRQIPGSRLTADTL